MAVTGSGNFINQVDPPNSGGMQKVENPGIKTFKDSHQSSDTDADRTAIHHTLGYGPNQAAPGTVVQQLQEQTTDLIGEVKLWILASPPPHYLECKGQSLNTVDYPDLFKVIGYTWGGAGATFKLPDAQNRFLMGAYGDVGASDAVANPATRNTFQQHVHTHDLDVITSTGAVIHGDTTSGGGHNHTVTDITDVDGFHSHIEGAPNATFNASAGGSAVAGQSHTHTISGSGDHTHNINILTNPDTGHNHTVDVELPAHNHSGTTDTSGPNAHPYLKFMVIIRYESGIYV